jgi:hypothetical protein
VVTHPVLYAAGLAFTSAWHVALAESLVALTEAALLVWWWRLGRVTGAVATAVWLAVAANAASTAVGLLR